MSKLLIKQFSTILGNLALKPVYVAPIASIAKRNIYYNFANTKNTDY